MENIFITVARRRRSYAICFVGGVDNPELAKKARGINRQMVHLKEADGKIGIRNEKRDQRINQLMSIKQLGLTPKRRSV